jgi:hypothetical protein
MRAFPPPHRARPGRRRLPVGRCLDHAKGLPVLHRSSSCMHAVAITPVESQSASFVLFLCNISLPRNHGGSASTSRLSRPARRSLALRPAYSPSHFHDPLHRRLQPFRYLHDCSDCYRLERKLPGGICTRWKTVPLHGAHDKGRSHQQPQAGLRADRISGPTRTFRGNIGIWRRGSGVEIALSRCWR